MYERLIMATLEEIFAYVDARRQVDQLRLSINDSFANIDFAVTPTSPVPPIMIEEAMNMSPPPQGELWLRNTRPFNAYGIPTTSIPCGFTQSGLRIGLQIAAPLGAEASLLSFAHAFEQAVPLGKQ